MAFSRLVSFLFSLSLLNGGKQPRCRCLYGQDCWPTSSDFTSLSAQLTQPLLYPKPPALPCYVGTQPSSSSSAESCSDVILQYTNGTWRADEPGSMQNTNFEAFMFPNGTIDACYLNATLGFPCLQGSIPQIVVDARTVADVQAAVKFVKQFNLRLVIKNTGHDYLGRSAGRGAFMVWTHNFKERTYNTSFIPDGAPLSQNSTYKGTCKIQYLYWSSLCGPGTYWAVTFGSGIQWHEAYAFVQEQGRSVVGGISLGGSVGAAGGWVMGGGHSAVSPSLGLGGYNFYFSLFRP